MESKTREESQSFLPLSVRSGFAKIKNLKNNKSRKIVKVFGFQNLFISIPVRDLY